MNKRANILSPVREGLDPWIWQGDLLHPGVKEMILAGINEVLQEFAPDPISYVLRVLVLGSITGQQWEDDADVDCNVQVDLDQLAQDLGVDAEILRINLRKGFINRNGELVPGTVHPVNYFVVFDSTYPPADGLYDVLEDVWIKRPGEADPDFDPYLAFEPQLDRAETLAEKIDTKWGIAVRSIKQMAHYPEHALPEKRRALRNLKALKAIYENLQEERHEVFDMAKEQGLPAPQGSTPNVTYKYLEWAGELDTLHKAVEVLDIYGESNELTLGEEKVSKIAAQTGDPVLDGVIEEFLDQPYEYVCKLEDEENPFEGEKLLVRDLEDPEIAYLQCGDVTEKLYLFLRQNLPEGYSPHMEGAHLQNTDFYSDDPYLDEHEWIEVETPSGTFKIDLTASQYGEFDFPLIEKVGGLGFDVDLSRNYPDFELEDATSSKYLTPEVVEDLKKIRDESRCGMGGACNVVSEKIYMRYGWPMESGYFFYEEDPAFAHYWNYLPNGAILDATADQIGLGYDIRVVEKDDPDYKQYRWEWVPEEDPDGEYRVFDREQEIRKERGDTWWLPGGTSEQYEEYKSKYSREARESSLSSSGLGWHSTPNSFWEAVSGDPRASGKV